MTVEFRSKDRPKSANRSALVGGRADREVEVVQGERAHPQPGREFGRSPVEEAQGSSDVE
jgi:hypothetical protein